MTKLKYRLLAFGLVLNICGLTSCQTTAYFNQNPSSVPQLRQQFQQQLDNKPRFFPESNPLNILNPVNSLTPLSPPISPLITASPFRYNQYNQQNYVPITVYQNELNLDGSFSYGYASADGTTAQAQGYIKNLGYGEAAEAQVIQGSYSYTSPEGTPITVRYIADENGFRAEGSHIPATPQYYGGASPYQSVTNPNLNPYQTPYQTRQFSSPMPNQRLGQALSPLQSQQQTRIYPQQNTGQYQLEQPFNQLHSGKFPAQYAGNISGFSTTSNQQQQQNFTELQQQQNARQNQQNEQQQQQQQQQQKNQQQQQQALSRQELQGRPNQLVDSYSFNQYRRFKKSTKK